MKSGTYRLSVGLVGFLQDKTPTSCEPRRALVEFPENPPKSDYEPDHIRAAKCADPATDRAAWARDIVPDSRNPLIPPDVRAKIENIEPEARAKGWPAELLWNCGFWDYPRGLAGVLDAEDEIDEVTPEYVVILKSRRDLLRFRRHVG